jgi:hypothetical protein
MNDYLNHKWRKFINEDKKPVRKRILTEAGTKRSGKGGVIKAKVVERSLPLPVPQISEAWGKPGNADREEAEKLLRRVATGTTWQEKIENLNTFVNSCTGESESACLAQADSTILSKLMALDILASIVYDFQASISGFLFEVFMATLIGGTSEQIEATQTEGEEDIADISALGKPLSLKLLRQEADYIEGSHPNLIKSIIKYGQPITYLVGLKEGGTAEVPWIRFYEFTIGSSAIVKPKGKRKWVYDPENTLGLQPGPLVGYFDVDDPEMGFHPPGADQFKVLVSILRGKSRLKKHTELKFEKETALLKFGTREQLEAVANNYTKQLNTDIVNVYNSLETLTKSMNDYLINSNINAGGNAITAAGSVRYYTKKITEDREE